MHLSAAFPGVDPGDTPGAHRGLVRDWCILVLFSSRGVGGIGRNLVFMRIPTGLSHGVLLRLGFLCKVDYYGPKTRAV